MRHKYHTNALVLSRSSHGEANTLVELLTEEVGLIRARAQGLRRPGAKLAGSLPTFAESEVILVRGAEGWRLVGAVLRENWFSRMERPARARAARVAGLMLRLVPGESAEPRLFNTVRDCLSALAERPLEEHDALECFAVLRALSVLGLDAGEVPLSSAGIPVARASFISRINRGIEASGL